jgi:hypothetical protein
MSDDQRKDLDLAKLMIEVGLEEEKNRNSEGRFRVEEVTGS